MTTPTIRIPNRFKLYERQNGDSCRLYVTEIDAVSEKYSYTTEPKRDHLDGFQTVEWEKKVSIKLPQTGAIHFQIVKIDAGKVTKLFFKATPSGVVLN